MKKSRLLGAVCACLAICISVSAHGAQVWSAAGTDAWSYPYEIFYVTDATGLGSVQITDVYIDELFSTAITDPSLLLTQSSADVHATDASLYDGHYDSGLISTATITSPLTLDVSYLSAVIEQPFWLPSLSQIECNSGICVADPYFYTVGATTTPTLTFSGTATLVAGSVGSIVPVPAALWLFGSGLLGLIGIARRKKLA